MLINPVTVHMSQHVLEAVAHAAAIRANRMSPNSPEANMLREAVDYMLYAIRHAEAERAITR